MMENLNSTHLYVTANSYPVLMEGLQALTKQGISPEVLSELLISPILAVPVRKLASLTQSYVQDASLVNLSLKKVEGMIKSLDNVNYDQLNDDQRERIMKFAEEVDHIDSLIRNDIYKNLSELHKSLFHKLHSQIKHNQDFLYSVGQCLDQNIDLISQKVGINVEWTQGKQISQWEEIEGWLSRYGDVDRSEIYAFRTQDASPQEELVQFIKTIVYAESLVACKDKASEGKGIFSSSKAEKIFKTCNKTSIPMPELKEEDISIELFEQMEGIYEEIESYKRNINLHSTTVS